MKKGEFKYQLEIGKRFSRLVILEAFGVMNRKRLVKCQCDCGNIKITQLYSLYTKNTESCGCLGIERRAEGTSKASLKHGESHGSSKSPEYKTWIKMKERCYWEKSNRYHRYGGRGIKVCERWLHSYENFLSDMGRKTSPNHSIDRIDNNGNYEPSNCRWSTDKEQLRNTSKSTWVTFKGERKTLREWCEIYKINYGSVISRVKRGWNIENLFLPAIAKYRNKSFQC